MAPPVPHGGFVTLRTQGSGFGIYALIPSPKSMTPPAAHRRRIDRTRRLTRCPQSMPVGFSENAGDQGKVSAEQIAVPQCD